MHQLLTDLIRINLALSFALMESDPEGLCLLKPVNPTLQAIVGLYQDRLYKLGNYRDCTAYPPEAREWQKLRKLV